MLGDASPEVYHDALSALGHGVLVYDRDLRVVFMNTWVREMFDIPADRFEPGCRFEDLIRFHAARGGYDGDGSVEERVQARLERVRSFEPMREDQPLFGGGQIQIVGHPVADGHYVITYTDITARKAAERALQDANSRFTQLFERTNEGWWFIEPSGTTVDVNPAMCAILGRSHDEIAQASIFDFVDDANRAIFDEQLRLRRSGVARPYEIALTRPDGSQVECINSPAPIYDDQGTHIGSIGLWTDISDLKQVHRELVEAEERAQVASRAKSDFLSTMSHELRTPLNAVLGFAQLLESDQDEPLSERQRESLHYIVEGGRHLLTLVTDILDLSRVESGAMQLDIERVVVHDVVSDCLALTRNLAEEHDVDLEPSEEVDETIAVCADHTRLRQAVLNLLSNAIKYNRPGGSVRIETQWSEDRWVRIAVADTGLGVRPEDLSDLFEPFKRLGAEKSSIEGAGIGLAFTRRVVEQMGGRVSVESELGVGSRFWIDLPPS